MLNVSGKVASPVYSVSVLTRISFLICSHYTEQSTTESCENISLYVEFKLMCSIFLTKSRQLSNDICNARLLERLLNRVCLRSMHVLCTFVPRFGGKFFFAVKFEKGFDTITQEIERHLVWNLWLKSIK